MRSVELFAAVSAADRVSTQLLGVSLEPAGTFLLGGSGLLCKEI